VVIGDWRLGIGDWRLGIGDWRLGIGDDRAAPNGHFDRLSASLEGRIEIGAYCIREPARKRTLCSCRQ